VGHVRVCCIQLANGAGRTLSANWPKMPQKHIWQRSNVSSRTNCSWVNVDVDVDFGHESQLQQQQHQQPEFGP